MPITFSCSCGKEMTVKDEFAGRKGKCPACGKVMLVPSLAEDKVTRAAAAAAAPAAEEPEARQSAFTENQPVVQASVAGGTKTCMHCRKQLPDDAVFCIHCGTHLRTGQKAASDHGGIEGDYDYMKVFPDLITKPGPAIDTIVQATPSGSNFQKAAILLVISSAIMAWMLYAVNVDLRQLQLPLWFVAVPFVLALAATVAAGIVAGIAGTMFGTTGLPFQNTFMAIIAVRTVVGLAMLVPMGLVYFAAPFPFLAEWGSTVIRIVVGAALMYLVISRSHDSGHVPALVFAGISALVEGMLFWIPAVLFTWILAHGANSGIMLF